MELTSDNRTESKEYTKLGTSTLKEILYFINEICAKKLSNNELRIDFIRDLMVNFVATQTSLITNISNLQNLRDNQADILKHLNEAFDISYDFYKQQKDEKEHDKRIN